MKDLDYIGKCLLINENGKKIMVIGDLHLGYEEALNESGVYIGRRMYGEMIEYLGGVFERVKELSVSDVRGVGSKLGGVEKAESIERKIVDEIVLLGDVKHVIGNVIRQEWNDVLALIDYLNKYCNKIIIIKGQHDAILEPILNKRKNVELLEFYVYGKYAFVHGDKAINEIEGKGIRVWIMGNGHPAVRISDGTKNEKFKCFLSGKYDGREIIICPSFSENNEGTDARDYNLGMAWKFDYLKFNAIVVGEDLVDLDFGKLGKLG